jgi:hypothetical protein
MHYYHVHCNGRYRYCEIEYDSREGKVIHGEDGKSVTSSIRIIRELREEEIRELLKGQVNYEVWRNEVTKKFHRENDLPAFIWYHKIVANGIVKDESKMSEKWYVNGKRHRDNNLPAEIWYYKNGNVCRKEWFKNGLLHRENDLPAYISYFENGSIEKKEWFINGKLHRENDLPAKFWYYKNGSVYKEQWWINGKFINKN